MGPRAEGLEEVLQGDANLALNATDGLLEGFGKGGIRLLDGDFVLQLAVVVKHIMLENWVNAGELGEKKRLAWAKNNPACRAAIPGRMGLFKSFTSVLKLLINKYLSVK